MYFDNHEFGEIDAIPCYSYNYHHRKFPRTRLLFALMAGRLVMLPEDPAARS